MGLCFIRGWLISKYTRIMQNNVRANMKRTRLEMKMDYYLYISFLFQIILCLFASLYHIIYVSVFKEEFGTWINYSSTNMFVLFIVRMGNWILIFGLFNKELHPHLFNSNTRNSKVLPGKGNNKGQETKSLHEGHRWDGNR